MLIEKIAANIIKVAAKEVAKDSMMMDTVRASIENSIEYFKNGIESNKLNNSFEQTSFVNSPDSRFPESEKYNTLSLINELDESNFQMQLSYETVPDVFKPFFKPSYVYDAIERNPTKFYQDIMSRFLEDTDKFSPHNWNSMTLDARKNLMYDAYKIFAEELCLSTDKIMKTKITYSPEIGSDASYNWSIGEINNETKAIKLVDEFININPDELITGNYFKAINSLFHETLHQFQCDMVENPGRYPVEAIRQEWYNSCLDKTLRGNVGDTFSYYSDSMEMFAHQNADYFTKTYEHLFTEHLFV